MTVWVDRFAGSNRTAREKGLVALGSLFVTPVTKVALRVEAFWAGKVSSICLGSDANATRQRQGHTERGAVGLSDNTSYASARASARRGRNTFEASRLASCLTSGEQSSQPGAGIAVPVYHPDQESEHIIRAGPQEGAVPAEWHSGRAKKGPGKTRQGSKRQHRTLSPAVRALDLLPNQVRWQ